MSEFNLKDNYQCLFLCQTINTVGWKGAPPAATSRNCKRCLHCIYMTMTKTFSQMMRLVKLLLLFNHNKLIYGIYDDILDATELSVNIINVLCLPCHHPELLN